MDLSTNFAYDALVPRPSQQDEDAIEESIKKHGQLFPIIVTRYPQTNKTYILDGHTRYRILKKLGIEPKIEYRVFKSPLHEMEFIINSNLLRRHLNDYQKVKLSLPLLEIEAKLAAERQKKGTLATKVAKGKSSDKVAKNIGINPRKYEKILYVIQNGDEKLKASVSSGKTKPSYAYKRLKKIEKSVKPSSFPPGKSQVVLMDPPWEYDNQTANGPNYNTLSVSEIAAFVDKDGRKITDVLADDAVMYLCTTGPKLEEAFELLKLLNLKYTTTIVWIKIRNDKIKFLNGYRVKGAAEYLLVATKGKPETPLQENIPPGVIFAESENKLHSSKPEVFYEIIEKAHPNQKKIELFARQRRDGWDSFGNPDELDSEKAKQKPKQKTLHD